jgi:hypothetical protein
LKERIRGRVADALDPLATRIARRPARRSKTTCKRPGENFTFSGQFSFFHFVATRLLVSLFLCGAIASPAGLKARSARQQF